MDTLIEHGNSSRQAVECRLWTRLRVALSLLCGLRRHDLCAGWTFMNRCLLRLLGGHETRVRPTNHHPNLRKKHSQDSLLMQGQGE